jgi:hypothetical protein
LFRKFHDTIQSYDTVSRIHIDPNQTRHFLPRKLRFNAGSGIGIINILAQSPSAERLATDQCPNQRISGIAFERSYA